MTKEISLRLAALQRRLGLEDDGDLGPITMGKLEELVDAHMPKDVDSDVHKVKASSFADPADVRAFKRCKAQGKSDQECFKVGDNGIGKWGDDTTGEIPMCALPPDDWRPLGDKARGAKVLVSANGREVVCELRDTMPAKKNIKNGAGIDLNPAACAALGLRPPVMISATWKWS